jgi:hypothetical protein
MMDDPKPKKPLQLGSRRTRKVVAPAPIGRNAVNRINSVVVAEDQDVQWQWIHLPDGGRFVSGYRLVPRSTKESP